MSISSTDCRARVEDGQPVWYLVPDGVVQYITKYRLYADPPGALPPEHPPMSARVAATT